jgi:hypothetical protein
MTNAPSCSDFIECALVSRSPKSRIPSFNIGCDFCGARIWVPKQAPLEPVRLCAICAATQADTGTSIAERDRAPTSRSNHEVAKKETRRSRA